MNKVLSDTGDRYTSAANPERGYHAYGRIIVFDQGTEPEYIQGFVEGIKAKDTFFMWFSHSVVQNLNGTLTVHVSHGFDSGD
jgi:hypothetical protein